MASILQHQFSEVRQHVENARGAGKRNEDKVDKVDARVDALNVKLDLLETRVDDLETRIEALENP